LAQRSAKVDRLLLYGSRARGDYTNRSDIDLALDAPAMTITEFADLAAALNDLPCLFKIDLLRLQDLRKSTLHAQIAKDAITLFARPSP
jgi:predicted nucleotidyltransferase